jgi:hypothetical protein
MDCNGSIWRPRSVITACLTGFSSQSVRSAYHRPPPCPIFLLFDTRYSPERPIPAFLSRSDLLLVHLINGQWSDEAPSFFVWRVSARTDERKRKRGRQHALSPRGRGFQATPAGIHLLLFLQGDGETMTGWRLIVAVGAVALLGACATPSAERSTVAGGAYTHVEVRPARTEQAPDRKTVRDEKGSVVVHMVPFEIGVSTVTVERMARQAGCQPRTGAGRLTGKGPVEVYRLQCENGAYFMAQCELRQCQPMRR